MSNSNHTFKSWRLNKRPVGEIKNSDLSLVEEDIPQINDNEVLARTIYFSLDPTNRIWMSDVDQYMEPVEIGDIMRAGGSIAIVEESKTKEKIDDIKKLIKKKVPKRLETTLATKAQRQFLEINTTWIPALSVSFCTKH